MSAFTFADNKLGGRLTAACDAIGTGHLRRAAGIFNEIADDLNSEAEATTGLLSDEVEAPAPIVRPPEPAAPQLATTSAPADLQMCGRGVHSFGPTDPTSGWRECSSCGQVNVAPPDNNGPIDMSARQ